MYALSFILVSTAVSYINVTDSWHYLPLIRNDYGRAYNETRITLGRPIIEDEFQPRIKGMFNKRQVWVLPDSLWRMGLHIAKRCETSKGLITFETDTYSHYMDSIEAHDLVITYDYPTRKESYELRI